MSRTHSLHHDIPKDAPPGPARVPLFWHLAQDAAALLFYTVVRVYLWPHMEECASWAFCVVTVPDGLYHCPHTVLTQRPSGEHVAMALAAITVAFAVLHWVHWYVGYDEPGSATTRANRVVAAVLAAVLILPPLSAVSAFVDANARFVIPSIYLGHALEGVLAAIDERIA